MGFFFILKGNVEYHFGRLKEAIKLMNQGIEILVESKSKEKEKIMEVYLKIAKINFKVQDFKKEYSNLICAQAMAKQLPNSSK